MLMNWLYYTIIPEIVMMVIVTSLEVNSNQIFACEKYIKCLNTTLQRVLSEKVKCTPSVTAQQVAKVQSKAY